MSMDFTGERMVPEAADMSTFWEHVYRYAFACELVKGLDVLDIASGEGYGTYALSKVAKTVVGVDISPEAVAHAKKKYSLDFRVGSAEQIPVEANSLDAVVSFETIEHVPNPNKFVEEVYRVLKPGGVFIVSTPNKDVYLKGQTPNPFHCSELTKDEFASLLNPSFQIESIHGQRFPTRASGGFLRMVAKCSNRLEYFLRRRIEASLEKRCAAYNAPLDGVERQRVVESIPTLSSPFNRLGNPFALRPLGRLPNGQPMYFMAVARKRRVKD